MDRQRLAAALVFMLTGAVLLCIFGWLRWGEALQPQPAISPAVKITKLSKPDCIDRSVGALHKRPVMHPISYRVKVPQNYAADRSWPLAVVLPAAGLSASMVEWHAGLTATLTARGFIVAYVASSGRLSTRTLQLYSKVPEQVSLDFCVDTDQVLWLGHSNGATASVALALGKAGDIAVGGLVLSGVGWSRQGFEGESCPAPIDVLVQHGANDRHFPGYGRQTAAWFAACNQCEGEPVFDSRGCLKWAACAAMTRYCESPRRHWRWAGDSAQVDLWLDQAARD